MRKILKPLGILLFLSLAGSLFAGDRAEVWIRLYRRAVNMEQKQMILYNIIRMDDRSFEPVLIEALEEMNGNQQKFRGNVSLMSQWVDMTGLIVKELGELKTLDAEDQIYFVVTHTEDPYLIANALIALGDIRSVKYAPDISIILRNLNYNTQQEDKDTAEIQAYGAVLALQKMRESIGFEPVFYAYQGWYSKRTKELAGRALTYITEDPTDPILEIMKDADYKTKQTALMVEKDSSAPVEKKTSVAIQALEEGLRYQASDRVEQDELSRLRVEAMKILIESKSKDNSAVPFMKEIFKRQHDLNECLYSLYALGVIGSDDAVNVLIDYLEGYNKKQQDGFTATRDEMEYIKQIIKSIGMSGNALGMGILTEVQFSNYTPAINRLAKEAMDALGN